MSDWRPIVFLILDNGRPSVCSPCPNSIIVKDVTLLQHHIPSGQLLGRSWDHRAFDNVGGSDIFQRTRNDDKPGCPKEDNRFLVIMEDGFIRNDNGDWVAPLPFRDEENFQTMTQTEMRQTDISEF